MREGGHGRRRVPFLFFGAPGEEPATDIAMRDGFSLAEFGIRSFNETVLMFPLDHILFNGVRGEEGFADLSPLGERVEALF